MAKIKLTPEIQNKIVNLIKAGNYVSTSCQVAGISAGTYYLWLKKGMENKNKAYRDFYKAVKIADAESEVYYLKYIKKAAIKNWQAAAWMLERKWPAKYGRKIVYDTPKDIPEKMKTAEVTVEKSGNHIARVLEILIESGGVSPKLIENNSDESDNQGSSDTETE